MKLSDILFGETEISEPVLLELLSSPEIKRLKNISSAGYYPAELPYSNKQVSRWYHSLGVFILLRRFEAPIEEQIAGLLHDVSHSAFSHTVDYIKKDLEEQKVQSAQDKIHNEFIKKSSLKKILEKYGYDVDYILNDTNFPLKENDLPDICADRLDYALRWAYIYEILSLEQIHQIVDSLQVFKGSFVFGTPAAASLFCNSFGYLNENCWSGICSAVMFSCSAQLFRRAIEQGYVTFQDFYEHDDTYILDKIGNYLDKDAKLEYYHSLLHQSPENFVNDLSSGIEPIFVKNRIVDPLVNIRTGFSRFSDLNNGYKQKIVNLPKFKEYRVVPKATALAAE